MLKLSSSGMKKGMSILLAAFFVVYLTAVAASAHHGGHGGRGGYGDWGGYGYGLWWPRRRWWLGQFGCIWLLQWLWFLWLWLGRLSLGHSLPLLLDR